MNLLSLFNGISGGMLACERVGIKIENHFASEIDKFANKITLKNYPDTKMLGDVNNWEAWNLPNIDLMIWGSPCQDLSIAKKDRKGLDGERSGLFWVAVEIWKKYKPKYWIMENVASMSKENQNTISNALGVKPILINSSLVSGQHRKRLYWTNLNITIPANKNIMLKDVLESGIVNIDKSFCLDDCYYKGADLITYVKKSKRQLVFEKPNKIGYITKNKLGDRVYSVMGKSVSLKASSGGWGVKTGLYKIDMPDGDYCIRKLTPIECERLQTYPDNWTEGVSNTQRYKMLGNSFTVDVISHILKGVKND